jgi:hypothetical protein
MLSVESTDKVLQLLLDRRRMRLNSQEKGLLMRQRGTWETSIAAQACWKQVLLGQSDAAAAARTSAMERTGG